MIIIGVDYHPEFQQITLLDKETGELQEKQLLHPEEAEQFYRALRAARAQTEEGSARCRAHSKLMRKDDFPRSQARDLTAYP